MEQRIEDTAVSIRDISWPLYQSKGWIKFIGVLSIIQGIVLALTLIGIIVAWLPIWIGVLLMQCASSVERARQSGDKVLLVNALDKLRTYFTIQGIMTLLSIVVVVIAFAMGVLGAIMGILSSMGSWHQRCQTREARPFYEAIGYKVAKTQWTFQKVL